MQIADVPLGSDRLQNRQGKLRLVLPGGVVAVATDVEGDGPHRLVVQADRQQLRRGVDVELLHAGAIDVVDHEAVGHLDLQLEQPGPFDGVLNRRGQSQLVISKDQLGRLIDQHARLDRLDRGFEDEFR